VTPSNWLLGPPDRSAPNPLAEASQFSGLEEEEGGGLPGGQGGERARGGLGDVKWRPLLNVLFWNLNYYDSASAFAGDCAEPAKTFPKAMAISVVLVPLSYLLPLLVATGAAPDAPYCDGCLVSIAGELSGLWLRVWLTAAAAVACVGQFIAEMASDSFQLMGMADQGQLPACLAQRSSHGTPTVGVLLSAAGVVLVSRLQFTAIIELVNVTYLVAELIEVKSVGGWGLERRGYRGRGSSTTHATPFAPSHGGGTKVLKRDVPPPPPLTAGQLPALERSYPCLVLVRVLRCLFCDPPSTYPVPFALKLTAPSFFFSFLRTRFGNPRPMPSHPCFEFAAFVKLRQVAWDSGAPLGAWTIPLVSTPRAAALFFAPAALFLLLVLLSSSWLSWGFALGAVLATCLVYALCCAARDDGWCDFRPTQEDWSVSRDPEAVQAVVRLVKKGSKKGFTRRRASEAASHLETGLLPRALPAGELPTPCSTLLDGSGPERGGGLGGGLGGGPEGATSGPGQSGAIGRPLLASTCGGLSPMPPPLTAVVASYATFSCTAAPASKDARIGRSSGEGAGGGAGGGGGEAVTGSPLHELGLGTGLGTNGVEEEAKRGDVLSLEG